MISKSVPGFDVDVARNSSCKAQVLGGMPHAGETGKLTEWRGDVDETYAFSCGKVIHDRAASLSSMIELGTEQ